MASALDTTVELVTPENIAFRYQLAGPFRRFPAMLIDFVLKIIAVVIFSLSALLVGASIGSVAAALGVGAIMVFWFALSWFYGAFFEAMFNGKTPGKWMCGIRVVSTDGHPINGIQALLRNLLRVVDLAPPVTLDMVFAESPPIPIPTGVVGLIVMAFNQRMQRLGDLAGGTMVIVDERTWALPKVKVDDARVPALASFIPADFRVTPTLSKALAQYAERRAFLSPARRREVAKRLADPLLTRFEFRSDIDPDLLLYSLYWRVFLADSRQWTGELGSLAGSSPLLRDMNKPTITALPDSMESERTIDLTKQVPILGELVELPSPTGESLS